METRAEVLDRWQKLVNEYKVSGLTRKTFCEQKGIKPHSLYYYKNKKENFFQIISPIVMTGNNKT